MSSVRRIRKEHSHLEEKIHYLRMSRIIESDASARFKLDKEIEEAEASLAALVRTLDRSQTISLVCPYRSLSVFREQDSAFFFGRSKYIKKTLSMIKNRPLAAIVGASGVGKSSLMLGGVIPRLRMESGWLISTFRPKSNPVYGFALSIASMIEPENTEIEALVEAEKISKAIEAKSISIRALVDRIEDKHTPSGNGCLIVIDQFEEIYTNCQPRYRALFLDSFADALEFNSNFLKFALTVRADFLGHVISNRRLADMLDGSDVKLGPMNREELKDAIERPLDVVGMNEGARIEIEPGLTERIVEEIGDEAGSLPLLGFTLAQLWNKQAGFITHKAYDEIGGVQRALARHAEEIYEGMDLSDQEQAEKLLPQLVRIGEGTEHARRTARREDIGEANWRLVRLMANEDARLVVCGVDESDGQLTVELAHEALLKEWGRLKVWIDKDREFLLWHERLRTHLEEWQAGRGALLRDASLAEAEKWNSERTKLLNNNEHEYIAKSLEQRTAEVAARTQLRKRIYAALAVSILVFVALATVAGFQWRKAEQQAAMTEIQARKAREKEIEAEKRAKEAREKSVEAKEQALLALKKEGEAIDAKNKLVETNFELSKLVATSIESISRSTDSTKFFVGQVKAREEAGRFLLAELFSLADRNIVDIGISSETRVALRGKLLEMSAADSSNILQRILDYSRKGREDRVKEVFDLLGKIVNHSKTNRSLLAQATDIKRKTLELAPESSAIHFELAELILNKLEESSKEDLKGKEEAESLLNRAIELDPENHQALFLLGRYYRKLNLLFKARSNLQQAADTSPETVEYRKTLGDLLFSQRLFVPAATLYKEVVLSERNGLENDPSASNIRLISALEAAADALYHSGSVGDSLAYSREVIEMPDVPAANNDAKNNWITRDRLLAKVGNRSVEQGDYESAFEYSEMRLEVALRLAARNAIEPSGLAQRYGSLAWHSLLSGRFEKAQDACVSGLEQDNEKSWIKANLAHSLLMQGQFEKAKKIYLENRESMIGDETWSGFVKRGIEELRDAGIAHSDSHHIITALSNSGSTGRRRYRPPRPMQ